MGQRERRIREKLHHEIPVGRGVEGVSGNAGEAQFPGDHLPVEGKVRSCHGARPQRQDVYATQRLLEPFTVALEHFHISEAVVAPAQRLGAAQMRVGRQKNRRVARRVFDESQLKGFQIGEDQLD